MVYPEWCLCDTLEVSDWSPAPVILLLSSKSTSAWGSSTTIPVASPSSLSWPSKKPSSTEVHRTFCFLRPIASWQDSLDKIVFTKEALAGLWRLWWWLLWRLRTTSWSLTMSPFQIADNIVDRVVVRFATIFYFFLDDKKFSTFFFIPERESFLYHIKSRTECFIFSRLGEQTSEWENGLTARAPFSTVAAGLTSVAAVVVGGGGLGRTVESLAGPKAGEKERAKKVLLLFAKIKM